MSAQPLRDRLIPPGLMLAGGTSMYVGAAIAVLMFEYLAPAGIAWLRIVGAAIVLWIVVRPPKEAFQGRRALLAGTFGTLTALMNIAFYEAIARLPLGTAVAIEFCGPVVVAALGSRTWRDFLALLSAALGVVLIADVHIGGSPLGVALALTAAACWAGYIVLGKKVASAGSGIKDLAAGFVIAAVLTSPLAVLLGPAFEPAVPTMYLLALGVGLGVASNAIPYVLDQVVLRRVGQSYFAVLLALLPVAATAVGVIALGQVPRLGEALGIAAIVVAVAVRKA